MKKKELKGLDALVQPEQLKPTETARPTAKKEYKTVSYSINALLDEQMRYIAYFDRKEINEVVEEAFRAYVKKWKPAEPIEANLPK